MLNELKDFSTFSLLIIYSIFLIAITFLIQSFLVTDAVFYNTYANQLSYDRIEELIDGQSKYSWISYATSPILYTIKFLLVSCCLLTGSLFFNIKLSFQNAFKAAILADLIFVIPLLIKIFWFISIQKDYDLQDLQQFSALSALNFFNIKSVSIIWLYPLQTISIFEFLYVLALGFWVYQFGAKTYQKGLSMVLGSYIPGLFVWMVFVMFVTVNLNGSI